MTKIERTTKKNTELFKGADEVKEKTIQMLRYLPDNTPFIVLAGNLKSFKMARSATNSEMMDLLIGFDLRVMDDMGIKYGPEGFKDFSEVKQMMILKNTLIEGIDSLITNLETAIAEVEKEEAEDNDKIQ